MQKIIDDFRLFAESVSLKLEYASTNEIDGYLNLFSYFYKGKREYCMYLYGENQFDTSWEYEYHDYLTIGRKLLKTNDRVLILGSGDLMNHRFLGTYNTHLIDINPFMTQLAVSHPLMLQLNQYTLSPDYHIHNGDAVVLIEENKEQISDYQYIVIDFPVMVSPIDDEVKKFGLEKFFSKEMFVDILLKNLSPDGCITMQADDTITHIEHEQHFRSLIEGTNIYFHIYSITFKDTELKQYFYMFTKNENIYKFFKKNMSSTVADPGLFRKDSYFIQLFELFAKNQISYEEYMHVLSGK